jgi:two-component system NtrC family sensor kinase
MGDGLALLLVALVAGTVGFLLGRRRSSKRITADTEQHSAELARRLNNLQSLQELSFSLSESLQLDRLVEQVVKYLSRSIDSDGVLVAVTGGERHVLEIVAAHGTLASLKGRRIKEGESGLIGEAMGAEHIQVAHTEDGRAPQVVEGAEVQTAAVTPLRAHGVTVGAIAAVREYPDPFSSTDLRQLSTVATHTAIVLENARLFTLVTSGKRQWEATFDALTDGVVVLDGDDRILRANRTIAELLGTPIPAVVNTDFISTLTGDLPAVRSYLAAARSGKASSTLTVQAAPIGRTLRMSADPMPGDGDGSIVVLVEDVTEREAMEANLIQSEKMAAVGHLVSGVAHELNNPLTSIAGVSDLLLEKASTSPDELPHLKLIHQQAERASHIVRNLLTFARKGPAGTAAVDLNQITESAVSLIEHDMKLRQIDLGLDLCESPLTVTGDKHELQQIVLNLLTNAVQAVADIPEGQPRKIRLITSSNNRQAILVICDSGPGIPEHLLPQVFLPFFTTKGPGEGTGLGLSITYRLVESHGGTIVAGPGPDGGTQFTVTLPLPADDDPLHTSPVIPPVAQTPAPVKHPRAHIPARILVVDQDPAVRLSLNVLLTDAGHTVSETGNASQALHVLRSVDFDLVVVEPEISLGSTGIAEAILDEFPELRDRLVLITADVRVETGRLLRSTGCRLLHKPLSPEQLRSTISEILHGP